MLRLRAAAARTGSARLFLLPSLVVLGGIVLAELAAAADDAIGPGTLPLTVGMSSNAATWLLSTVAGATITTAGLVFSLTVVSLQLASSQFSPRVMRSFIRDRFSRVVTGLLVATFELRQAAPPQPMVVAALRRVLRMLVVHVQLAGRADLVPAPHRQVRMPLESAAEQPGLHRDDLAWLRSLAADETDPADHTNRAVRDLRPGAES